VAGCDVVAAAGEAAPPRATAAIDRTSLTMCLIMVAARDQQILAPGRRNKKEPPE